MSTWPNGSSLTGSSMPLLPLQALSAATKTAAAQSAEARKRRATLPGSFCFPDVIIVERAGSISESSCLEYARRAAGTAAVRLSRSDVRPAVRRRPLLRSMGDGAAARPSRLRHADDRGLLGPAQRASAARADCGDARARAADALEHRVGDRVQPRARRVDLRPVQRVRDDRLARSRRRAAVAIAGRLAARVFAR